MLTCWWRCPWHVECCLRSDAVPDSRRQASDAATLRQRRTQLAGLMDEHMWDESLGVFANVLTNGTRYPRISPTSFYPMWSGTASDAQATRMVYGNFDILLINCPTPFPAMCHLTRAVHYVIRSGRADWVGACNPVLCPIHGFRTEWLVDKDRFCTADISLGPFLTFFSASNAALYAPCGIRR